MTRRTTPPSLHRAESAALRELLDGTIERGEAVTLLGPVGSGRSFLLEEAAGTAQELGMTVLRTAGRRDAPPARFAGLRALLGPVADRIDALPARPREALRRALDPGRTDADTDDLAVAVGALGVLEDAAEDAPLLVAVDDADLLDTATVDALAFVARRLTRRPISIVEARLPIGQGPVIGLRRLTVAPLTGDAAEVLLDMRAGALDAAVRRRVLLAADGNALAVEMLARGAAEHDALDVLLGHRLPVPAGTSDRFVAADGPTEGAWRMLVLLAEAHDTTTAAELVAAAADLGVDSADARVLEDRRLVELDPDGRHRFAHPLLGHAVHAAASAEDRALVHRALAARTLDPLHAAVHLALADHRAASPTALDAASVTAMRRNDRTAAGIGFRTAAALPAPEPEVAHRLLLAAEMARQGGQGVEGVALLERAAARTMAAADVARSVIVHVRLRRPMGTPARSNAQLLRDAVDLPARAEDAIELPGEREPIRVLRGRALGVVGTCIWLDGSPAGDVGRLLASVPAQDEDRSWEERVAAAIVDPTAVARGFRDDLATHLLTFVRSAPVFDAVLLTYSRAAESIGALDLAEQAWTVQLDDHRAGGAAVDAIVEQVARGRLRLATGNLTAALADAEEATALAVAHDLPRVEHAARAVAAVAAALLGRSGEPEPAAADPRAAPLQNTDALTAWAEGLRAAADGDATRAFAALRVAAGHPASSPWSLPDLADAARTTGRIDEVAEVILHAVEVAERTGSPWLRAAALRARGAAGLGPDPRGDLEAAVEAASRSGSPHLVAGAHLDLGRLLLRTGDLVAAREHLATAARLLRSVGAVPLAEQADRATRSAGAGTAETTTLAPAPIALGERELQVARLAAAGLTNKVIGERLHLSPRTVGAQLYRLFPRLGITRRSQLAGALAPFDDQRASSSEAS